MGAILANSDILVGIRREITASEMRGPRLMQQLRERAGKIVQHLTVEQVTSSEGIILIKNAGYINSSPSSVLGFGRIGWERPH